MAADPNKVAAMLKGKWNPETVDTSMLGNNLSGDDPDNEEGGDGIDLSAYDNVDDDGNPIEPAPVEPTAPIAEAWKPPTQAEWEAERAEAQKALEESQGVIDLFEQNPEHLAKLLLPRLSKEQQGQLLAQLGITPQNGVQGAKNTVLDAGLVLDVPVEELAPEGQFLVRHADFIRDGKQHVEQVYQTVQDNEARRQYDVAVLQEQVGYLVGLLQAELPAHDINKVAAHLKKTNGDIGAAVKAVYGGELALKRQQAAPRPNTPRNAGGGGLEAPKLSKNAGLAEMGAFMRRYGKDALLKAVESGADDE